MAVATTACTADASQPGADDFEDRFAMHLSDSLEWAESAGASAEQIEILEQAKRTGKVPFDVYSEAVDNALRCLREAGHDPYDGGIREEFGYPLRFYTVPVEAEAADEREPRPGMTVHRCIAEHSIWVEMAYQNQPASLEAQEAHQREVFDSHRDEIVDCAVREGIEVDPGGDILEIVSAAKVAYGRKETDVDCTEGIG